MPAPETATYLQRPALYRGFLESAGRYGDRRALEVSGSALTYDDLKMRALALAATIQRRDAGSSPLVSILAQRSPSAFVGILGALLAGRGYVPLNPTFPALRNRQILQRSGARTIITDRTAASQLPEILDGEADGLLVIVEDETEGRSDGLDAHDVLGAMQFADANAWLAPDTAPDDVAYLLFTSGSTGVPKGVAISHENADTFVREVVDRYELNQRDRISQAFELTFDVSVFDMFATWAAGACLCCPSRATMMKPGKFIADSKLTVWYAVPSVSAFMKRFGELTHDRFPDLRLVMFIGEALPVSIAQAWSFAAPNARLVNTYGPTEATVAVSDYWWDDERSPSESEHGVVPIGDAYSTAELLVVDDRLNDVEAGQTGELLIGGPQVAKGYWHDPERTSKAFVSAPGRQGRYYRTGDLVRKPLDGSSITFLGRLDTQIKIAGFRVELGEIEAVLRECSATDEVVVLAWPVEHSVARGIVAFVGSDGADEETIRAAAQKRLPYYMVPGTIRILPSLPRNASGKLDRAALARSLEEQA